MRNGSRSDHASDVFFPCPDEPPHRILIVRALPGLGDFLVTTPAWRALRAALPGAQMTLLTLPQVKPLVQRFSHYLDRFLEFPGFPGIPEREPALHALPAFLADVQAQNFDLALQMHGSGVITNPFTILLGARQTAGFHLPGHYCPDPERFLLFDEEESELRAYLRLMTHLGIPPQGEALEFPLTPSDWEALARIPEMAELQPGQYMCVHPGAKLPERRWSPERFARVADALARLGLRIVLTGTQSERALAQEVSRHMVETPLNLAGRTSLGALAALMANARLLLCNDTGVSHLAAALRLPSIVIFVDPTVVSRWAPLDETRHRIVAAPRNEPHQGPVNGSNGISPERVIHEAETLLQQPLLITDC